VFTILRLVHSAVRYGTIGFGDLNKCVYTHHPATPRTQLHRGSYRLDYAVTMDYYYAAVLPGTVYWFYTGTQVGLLRILDAFGPTCYYDTTHTSILGSGRHRSTTDRPFLTTTYHYLPSTCPYPADAVGRFTAAAATFNLLRAPCLPGSGLLLGRSGYTSAAFIQPAVCIAWV